VCITKRWLRGESEFTPASPKAGPKKKVGERCGTSILSVKSSESLTWLTEAGKRGTRAAVLVVGWGSRQGCWGGVVGLAGEATISQIQYPGEN